MSLVWCQILFWRVESNIVTGGAQLLCLHGPSSITTSGWGCGYSVWYRAWYPALCFAVIYPVASDPVKSVKQISIHPSRQFDQQFITHSLIDTLHKTHMLLCNGHVWFQPKGTPARSATVRDTLKPFTRPSPLAVSSYSLKLNTKHNVLCFCKRPWGYWWYDRRIDNIQAWTTDT